MNRYFMLVLLLVVSSLYSCSDKRQLRSNIDFSFEKLSKSVISEKISDYSIVKLETTEDSKINIIKKVVINAEKIYVLNFQENKQEILIFSLDGRYIGKISGKDEGGYGFSSITDFDIQPVNGNVTVLDNKQKSVFNFSGNAEYIDSCKIGFQAEEIAYGINDGSTFFVLHAKSSDGESGSEIAVYDDDCRLLKTFFSYSNKRVSCQSNERTLMKRNGNVMFLREGTNNLYQIGLEECLNISDFIFPKPVLPADKMYDAFFSGKVDLGNYVYNVDYFESDSIVYVTFSNIENNYIGIENKKSGCSSLYNMLLNPACKCGIKIEIVGSYKNCFIVQIPRAKIRSIIEILDSERSKCSNEEMFEIIDHMKPGENPVLLLLEFKF